MPGVHPHRLTRLEVEDDHLSRRSIQTRPWPADLLEDEALATEDAAAERLLEAHGDSIPGMAAMNPWRWTMNSFPGSTSIGRIWPGTFDAKATEPGPPWAV